jgi:hypothetical protein
MRASCARESMARAIVAERAGMGQWVEVRQHGRDLQGGAPADVARCHFSAARADGAEAKRLIRLAGALLGLSTPPAPNDRWG